MREVLHAFDVAFSFLWQELFERIGNQQHQLFDLRQTLLETGQCGFDLLLFLGRFDADQAEHGEYPRPGLRRWRGLHFAQRDVTTIDVLLAQDAYQDFSGQFIACRAGPDDEHDGTGRDIKRALRAADHGLAPPPQLVTDVDVFEHGDAGVLPPPFWIFTQRFEDRG